MKKFLLLSLSALSLQTFAAEKLPPSPEHYFNDYAGLVSKSVADSLDAKLIDLEKQTTIQFVVATFPTLESDSQPTDYAQRVMQSWHVGQKKTNNGVTLFIFLKDKAGKTDTVIQTGYGLEGALPDATCKAIIDNDIRPHVRAAKAGGGVSEWNAALTSGVNSVIKAAQGEYKVETNASVETLKNIIKWAFIIIVCLVILMVLVSILGGGGYSSSYSSGSWGSSGGGGGGFSGGGGSCGGGGASGSD